MMFAKLKSRHQTNITLWEQRAGWGISDLDPEKGHKAKKQASNKPTQWKHNSKAGWLVGHRVDLRNLRTSHSSLREELTKQLLLKDRKENWRVLPNNLVRLWQSFCLNTNTRTRCWKSSSRTTKTEILLFLNLEFYFFMCLFSYTSWCWFLWFSLFFFFFLSFFVLLVLLL
jgi:hypothetical protein